MKKLSIIIAAISFIALSASAQDNLHLLLKDGSELNGYISKQKPGENFTFSTNSATIKLPGDKVKSTFERQIPLADLPEQWAKWAKDNNFAVNTPAGESLVLSDIYLDGDTVKMVRILEKGIGVKYLELTPNSYTVDWDNIEIIKNDVRPTNYLSGINRKYKLKSGQEYEGQYIEEIPNKTISLFHKDGYTHVFNYFDVIKDNRIAVNPNQSIVEQSDLLDIVVLKNGTKIKGVIFERNYSDSGNAASDYLLIQLADGSSQSVPLDDIVEYGKEKNPAYRVLTEVEIADGACMVNREEIKAAEVTALNGDMMIDPDSAIAIKRTDNHEYVIETKQKTLSDSYAIYVVPVQRIKDKKKTMAGYTYESLVRDSLLPQEATLSPNGICRMTYNISKSGGYVIYNALTDKAYLISID